MVNWNKIFNLSSVAAGTALLAIAAFDVPIFKQVYLAPTKPAPTLTSACSASADLQNGQGLQCSSPHLGYNLSEVISLLAPNITADGNNATAAPPPPSALTDALSTVTSGFTTVLVLHMAAFGIALISFACALLGFIGTPIADTCSLCFCGFAGAAAFAVFIFDLAFFEVVKKRVQCGPFKRRVQIGCKDYKGGLGFGHFWNFPYAMIMNVVAKENN
ncbi:hypothetical protein C8R45DRAFT_921932 [Mycena sanguinolenta]|nr:hypothetical protein C8R45DRAFT_921932 [Mycena sanguinolenta]